MTVVSYENQFYDYVPDGKVYRAELETHYPSASVRIIIPQALSDTLTVTRTDAVFGTMTVRGGSNLKVSEAGGSLLIEDAEIPLDTPMQYCVVEDFGEKYSQDSCSDIGWTITNATQHPSNSTQYVADSISLITVSANSAIPTKTGSSYFLSFPVKMALTSRDVLGLTGSEFLGIRSGQLRLEFLDASGKVVYRMGSDPVEVTDNGVVLRYEFTVPEIAPDPGGTPPATLGLRVSAVFGDDKFAFSQKLDTLDFSHIDKTTGTAVQSNFHICERRGMPVQVNLIPNPTFYTDAGAPWWAAIPPAYATWKEKYATRLSWKDANSAWEMAGTRKGSKVCVAVDRSIPGRSTAQGAVLAPKDIEQCHTYPAPGCGWGWEGREATTVFGIDPTTVVDDAFFMGPLDPWDCSNGAPVVNVQNLVLQDATADYCLGGVYSTGPGSFSIGTSYNLLQRLETRRPYRASVEARSLAGYRKSRMCVDMYYEMPGTAGSSLIKYATECGNFVELQKITDKEISVEFFFAPPQGLPDAVIWAHFRAEFGDIGDGSAAARDAVAMDPQVIIEDTGPGLVTDKRSAGMILGASDAQKIVVKDNLVYEGNPPEHGQGFTDIKMYKLLRIPKASTATGTCSWVNEPQGYVAGDRYRLSGNIIINRMNAAQISLPWDAADIVLPPWDLNDPNLTWDDLDFYKIVQTAVQWKRANLLFDIWKHTDFAIKWRDLYQYTTAVAHTTADLYLVMYGANDAVLESFRLGTVGNTDWFHFDHIFTAPPGLISIGLAHGEGLDITPMRMTVVDPVGMEWKVDGFVLEHESARASIPFENNPWRMEFLDGYAPLPTRDPWLTVPDGGKWEIGWCGEPNCSPSYIRAPSKLKWCLPDIVIDSNEASKLSELSCVSVHLVDPLLPHAGSWAIFQSLADWELPSRMEKIPVIHRYTPVAISDLRLSRTNTITLLTKTLAQRSKMYRMLNYGRVLLLQFPRSKNWGETALYIAIDDVSETYISEDMSRPERKWTIPFQVVNRPLGLMSSATRISWEDVTRSGIWTDWTGLQFKVPDWDDLVFNDLDDPYHDEVPSPVDGGVFPVDYSVNGVRVPAGMQPAMGSVSQRMASLHQAQMHMPVHYDSIRAIGPGTP